MGRMSELLNSLTQLTLSHKFSRRRKQNLANSWKGSYAASCLADEKIRSNCWATITLVIALLLLFLLIQVNAANVWPQTNELPTKRIWSIEAANQRASNGSMHILSQKTANRPTTSTPIEPTFARWADFSNNRQANFGHAAGQTGSGDRLLATKAFAAARSGRNRRSAPKETDSTTRIVAVSGQLVELQCPLASELLAVANSGAPSSRPDHSIVWRKNAAPLSQLNPRIKVYAHNGSLIIAAAQPKLDDANYECALVHNSKEDQAINSHRFELKLIVPPIVAPFEFPANAQVGMKVVLTCSVLEGQQPISFVWLKDNQIIHGTDSGSSPSSGLALSGSSGSLVGSVNSLSQMHQQQLADKLALSASSFNSKSEYSLVGATSSSSSTSGKPNENGIGDGESQQLLPLLSDSNIRVRQADDYSILAIAKLELKHSGRYTCSVQNEAARSSHSSQLAINAPPTLTVEPKDGDLVSGQSTVIDCAASGHPRPSVSWLRARESSSKQWDYVPVYDNLRYTTLSNGSLAIANVTLREQGYYLCSAKNGFGPEVTKLIKITVHEPARFDVKYKTLEVRIEERANMLCVASGELPVNIEWLDKEGNTILKSDKRFIIDNDPQDIRSTGTHINATLSRLILARSGRADSGHYTCQASNRHGSDKMVTNLLVQDVPDKLVDLKVTNATATTISLRWQLAFTGNSPVSSYLVQYQSDDPLDDLLMTPALGQRAQSQANEMDGGSTSSLVIEQTGGLSNVQQVPSASASLFKAALDALNIASSVDNADEAIDRTLVELTVEQSATNLVVKDLSPYCVYRLRLAGINKIGLGEFSDWIRVKTEEAAPTGSALKINAAATGPNSIKLTWSPPDRRSWNGQLIGFNIGYRPIDSSLELNKTVEWVSPSLQSIMLDAGGRQKILAMRKAVQLKQGTEISDDNKHARQTVRAKQSATTGNATSVSQQVDGDSKGSQYLLRQHLRQLLALQQQELVAHLTNLQRSTTYLVWIQAANNRGLGPQSHAVSVKTLDDVPPSAPAIKIKSATPNSITISWSMLSNFISAANQYSLFYRRVPQSNSAQIVDFGRGSLNKSGIVDFAPAGSLDGSAAQFFEPGPFIERTMNSQQLMVSGNLFPSPDQEANLVELKQPFMHQQAQHYQQFEYTLDQLECGSVYELYMTTRNSVGKSEPSSVVTTRTLGEPPQAPLHRNSLFSNIGVHDVALNLASWSIGGCPMTQMTIRYKQVQPSQGPTQSSLVSSNSSHSSAQISWPISTSVPISLLSALNNQQLQSRTQSYHQLTINQPSDIDSMVPAAASGSNLQPIYTLKSLLPGASYELEIIAHNSAGQTRAHYEFVTTNLNGTRAGYIRKEDVYQSDHQRTQVDQHLDNSVRLLEQQASSSNRSNATAQIVGAIIMLLTILAVIGTLLHMFIDSKARTQHRRSSSDTGTSGPTSRGAGSHCQARPSSPCLVANKQTMWRNNDGHHSMLKHRDIADSPNTLHYCARDPMDNNQMMLSTTLNSKKPSTNSFSQSVSMKDFNFAAQPGACSTLNFAKSCRNSALHSGTMDMKAGTMRNRMPIINDSVYCADRAEITTIPDDHNYNTMANNNFEQQMCSVYAAACKQQKQISNQFQDQDPYARSALVGNNGQQASTSFTNGTQYDANHYNYVSEAQIQQDTGWSNYVEKHNAPTTAYAIPTANAYGDPPTGLCDDLNNESDNHVIADCRRDNYGQTSIDACIQQLVSQQYQQQQQQYAMIVNQKLAEQNRGNNMYGNESSISNQQTGQSVPGAQTKFPPVNCGQSIIDSSSSSSGIDVGAQIDCASSTSHSNGSNGYQLTQNPNCEQNSINEHLQRQILTQQTSE